MNVLPSGMNLDFSGPWRLDRSDFNTLIEAVELWEEEASSDQLIDQFAEQMILRDTPDAVREAILQPLELLRVEALREASERKERGTLLRAKLIQLRDMPTVHKMTPFDLSKLPQELKDDCCSQLDLYQIQIPMRSNP